MAYNQKRNTNTNPTRQGGRGRGNGSRGNARGGKPSHATATIEFTVSDGPVARSTNYGQNIQVVDGMQLNSSKSTVNLGGSHVPAKTRITVANLTFENLQWLCRALGLKSPDTTTTFTDDNGVSFEVYTDVYELDEIKTVDEFKDIVNTIIRAATFSSSQNIDRAWLHGQGVPDEDFDNVFPLTLTPSAPLSPVQLSLLSQQSWVRNICVNPDETISLLVTPNHELITNFIRAGLTQTWSLGNRDDNPSTSDPESWRWSISGVIQNILNPQLDHAKTPVMDPVMQGHVGRALADLTRTRVELPFTGPRSAPGYFAASKSAKSIQQLLAPYMQVGDANRVGPAFAERVRMFGAAGLFPDDYKPGAFLQRVCQVYKTVSQEPQKASGDPVKIANNNARFAAALKFILSVELNPVAPRIDVDVQLVEFETTADDAADAPTDAPTDAPAEATADADADADDDDDELVEVSTDNGAPSASIGAAMAAAEALLE